MFLCVHGLFLEDNEFFMNAVCFFFWFRDVKAFFFSLYGDEVYRFMFYFGCILIIFVCFLLHVGLFEF